MPARLRLVLDGRNLGPRTPKAAWVQGAAAAVFDVDDLAHRAQRKPWATRPTVRGAGGTLVLDIAWMPVEAPVVRPPSALRLGPHNLPVVAVDATPFPYLDLAVTPATAARLQFDSPTWFTHNGRDIPLPVPHMVFPSAAERWSSHAPLLPSPLALQEVLDLVLLTDFDCATYLLDLGKRSRTGFVGTVEFRLPRSASIEAAHAFAALCRFMAFAGVGAATTFGAGAVTLQELRD